MIDPHVIVPACEESLKSGPAASNAAIAACCNAFLRTYRVVLAKGSEFDATHAAIASYCAALPALTPADNIRDFIACVAHGLLLQIIEEARGARLLYAAQVARTAASQPAKTKASS
jgi:hypothetical protein